MPSRTAPVRTWGWGCCFSDLGDPGRAEESYRTAFRIDPDHIESRINLAELLFQQGDTAAAGELLEECVELAPERGVAHEALGRHRVPREGLRSGARISRRSRTLDAGQRPHPLLLWRRAEPARAFRKRARPRCAGRTSSSRETPSTLIGLATICRDHERWDLALGYARTLRDIDPRYADVHDAIEAQMRAAKK